MGKKYMKLKIHYFEKYEYIYIIWKKIYIFFLNIHYFFWKNIGYLKLKMHHLKNIPLSSEYSSPPRLPSSSVTLAAATTGWTNSSTPTPTGTVLDLVYKDQANKRLIHLIKRMKCHLIIVDLDSGSQKMRILKTVIYGSDLFFL